MKSAVSLNVIPLALASQFRAASPTPIPQIHLCYWSCWIPANFPAADNLKL